MTSPIAATFLRDTRHGGATTQAADVAAALTAFIGGATSTIEVAIYDFRLTGTIGTDVVGALIEAAQRGVAVRIGYDLGKPVAGTAADFAALAADPAPAGTADWVQQHFAGTAVQIKGIAAAPQLMHSKYVLCDAATPGGAVWTGSTNFTDDAWTLQENNILIARSPVLAQAYLADFDSMWSTGKIKGTGAGDGGTTTITEFGVNWDFAPGDGPAIDAALVALVRAARTRIAIAAMVLTSHPLLAALAIALEAGIDVSGIYDAGQMDPIVAQWKTIPADAAVLSDWAKVSAVLAAKHSTPYRPNSAHDFMHNKILICDDTVVTGSYNFSANAQRNAENQIRVTDAALAGEYADYLSTIAAAYRTPAGRP